MSDGKGKAVIGLDIGAVSLKLAALGAREDRPLLETLCEARSGFRMIEWPGGAADAPVLAISDHRPSAGSPLRAASALLEEVYSVAPRSSTGGLRVTGSASRPVAEALSARSENEFRALARMFGCFYPDVRTVFEIGASSAKYLRLEAGRGRAVLADYDRSGDCAAGTGSFLDQQAARMGYSAGEIGDLVRTAGCAPQIAGRCSVFAKSDMIHAQQKGHTPAEILRGLCQAVALNFKAAVVKGREIVAPVALIGGVSRNAGVAAALREVFGLAEGDLLALELYGWCGAIGAALLEAEEPAESQRPACRVDRQPEGDAPASRPLSLDRVLMLRQHVRPYAAPPGTRPIPCYLGVDVGSVSTNVVAINEAGAVIQDVYLRTAGRPIEAVRQGFDEIRREWGDRLAVQGAGTTGSGRELIAEVIGADVVNDEITAHKTGALHVSETMLGGAPVDTIFEIGGQDSKFISIEDGVVVDFAMNEACAAGTGSFLEEQAERLGICIQDEFARLALAAPAPASLGERCTVFMERDVIGRLNQGETVPNVAAGLAYSVALNYLNRVVRGRRIGDTIFFQGGTAYNDAVAAAFAGLLEKTIIVPPHNGVIGAIGMALIARDWRRTTGQRTRFRGCDLAHLRITSRDFTCRGCPNQCAMKQFTVEGRSSYWGDKCSDRYRKPSPTSRRPVIEDLFEVRQGLLEKYEGSHHDPAALSVGMPRCMSCFDQLPFWAAYFGELGIRVVLSPPTSPAIAAQGVALACAQPCYPVQVAHGHVLALIEAGVDRIFLPNLLDSESDQPQVNHFCPWNQTLPYVLASARRLEPHRRLFLTPHLHFQLGRDQIRGALAGTVRGLGVSRKASDRAVDAAYAAQHTFQSRLLEAGRRALSVLEYTGEPGILLLGRGYNIYDRQINCDIPRKLRQRYGANVIPIDFAVSGRESAADLHPNMYWASGRKILAAARLAASLGNLHLIYISNFKCGPDSYIKQFARRVAGKPFLVLQFDGHGNDAGYLTRCEAYLDSKGALRCHQPENQAVLAAT